MKGKRSSRNKTLKLSRVMAGMPALLLSMTFLAVIPATAAGEEVEVRVNAPEEVEEGESFAVTIDIKDVMDFNSGQFDLSFDSKVVEVTDVTEGSIAGETIPNLLWNFVDADTVMVAVYMPMGEGVSGSGHLAEVSFKVKGEGGDRSVLDIFDGVLYDTGVMLFYIEDGDEFKDELNDEEISEELKEIFKANGCPLENPTVNVIHKDERWKIIDRRVYAVTVRYFNRLKIQDTGEIVKTKWIDAEVTVAAPLFDTGEGTYPSISGTHEGTITPYMDISVQKMYTYPCAGTGGHSEYVTIENTTWEVNATWTGYTGEYHNIVFSESFTLYAGKTYNYTIRTGSYPMIIHAQHHAVLSDSGVIRCDTFVDANGKAYNDWIPAITLW